MQNMGVFACPIRRLYLMNAQGEIPVYSVAVLCTTGEINRAKLNGITYLHVPFEDVSNPSSANVFSLANAQQICRFIDAHSHAAKIFFCCDSGESRSAALAAATMHYLGQNEMLIWKNTQYHPNPLVYYIQSKAYGLEITQEDALELVTYNRQLFEQQIHHSRRSADTDNHSGGIV